MNRMDQAICKHILLLTVGLNICASNIMAETVICGADQHNLNGQRCCTKCPVSHGVIRPCSRENDTICRPCIFGESYSPILSHVDICHPCSICPEYAHMIQPCNMTYDTMCECDRNYFFDQVSQKCRPCQFCPMEYGVRRACNMTHDTLCARCPEGYYSDRLGMEPCKPCTMCRINQIMLQHCSPGQNTICIDIPTMHSTAWVPEARTDVGPFPSSIPSKKTNAIPIYCSILGAVIIALIIYVVIKQKKQRQLHKDQKLSKSDSADCPPLLNTTTPSIGGFVSKQGSDSGVFVEQDRPVFSSTKIRDLPPIKRKSLENLMHGCPDEQGGWKALARELGFSTPVISSIETRAHQDGFSPLRILLTEWGKRDNAVVGTLVSALRAIRRDDCVRILCGDNREYVMAPQYLDLNSMHGQMV